MMIFEIPGERICYYDGVRSNTPEVSSTKLTCLIEEGTCNGYLVSLQEVNQEAKELVDEIFVVQEFADVFPDELPGLPP